ncbi:transglutaminase TgpA family protein [Chitinimonas lacunae]|uniref:DUF3488 and DUF4129 domain-containing transglutaminase family protein n=1 Tax=Chitinimonas lacunae TaxID=1963018 RepID=A0ABV8MPX3_9NEIS
MTHPHLDRTQTLTLIVVLGALLAPHLLHLPLWLGGALAAMLLLRGWIARRQWRLPPRWLLTLATFALIGGVFAEFRTLLGRDGGVALLAVLVAAKLLETRARRDALLLVYISYFLVVTNFLFNQSVWMAAYLLLAVLATTALLIGWNSRGGWTGRRAAALGHWRMAGMLLLQSLPLMVLLFVLFPRIEGPLWRLPQDRAGLRSGLADNMSPGSFSDMSQNDEVAFRVSFSEGRPDQSQLYWRGPVYEEFDGRTWSQGAPSLWLEAQRPRRVRSNEVPVSYAITVEPHQRPWVLALDMPATVPDGARFTDHLQLVTRPLLKRTRFELSSYINYQAVADSEERTLLRRALQLPPSGNPRARAAAEAWRELPPQERVDAALRLFTSQRLRYTLQPPLYGTDPIDGFVFTGRQGFCEHFAGAFVFLMRVAGVPARVVGGYQGGEYNDAGDYLIVRQADAHAWTEVWLEDQGWVRVDPTFAVAPSRIERGLASAVSEEVPLMMRLDNNLVKQVRLMLDAAVNGWNEWVIGYNTERQRDMLRRLGIDSLLSFRFISTFLLAILAAALPVVLWLLWRARPLPLDPARRHYQRFRQRLAKLGVPDLPQQGPRDYAEAATRLRPELAAIVAEVTAAYIDTRYRGDAAALDRLRTAVATLGKRSA